MVELFITIKRTSVSLVLLAAFACLPGKASSEGRCQRIVALSPSLVEVVDQLGLTDNLVGVSRFTEYPEAAKALAQVGGLLDPNIEAIMSHRPTIVFGLSEHGDLLQKLEKLKLDSVTLDHRRLAGILESITRIGNLCGRQDVAAQVRGEAQSQIDRARRSTFGKKKERALVLVGGKLDAMTLGNLYVSGRDGFYADLLDLAGAENVFRGLTGAFSGVSREALIKQDPDFIFHVVSGDSISSTERRAILSAWRTLPYLSAVKKNQVFILSDYVDSIPGPRFALVLNKMYADLHAGAAIP